jgi:excinuclease ABC subunit A
MMEKPDVDLIEGLSPAISIEQKSTSHNPRSTVGTVTEIYDYLRLLFARVGTPRCPEHDIALEAQSVSQMVDSIMALPEDGKYMILAPVVRERKGEHAQALCASASMAWFATSTTHPASIRKRNTALRWWSIALKLKRALNSA